MKLQFKTSEQYTMSSIHAERIHRPHMGGNWHFHQEFELIYFLKGHGMRIVGDHISNFQSGELVLVGQWLPHLWRNAAETADNEITDFIVIKFTKMFGSVDLFAMPELVHVKALLKKANQGIFFPSETQAAVHDDMLRLVKAESTEKLILLLKVLRKLVRCEDYRMLSSPNFTLPKQIAGENRLHKVINYISGNYANNITLNEISKIAVMTPPAFCRFFKTRTNRTFSSFLNEVRISRACQFLINGESPIKQICYDVGFSSLTNFNRTFKSFMGISPSVYRDNYGNFRKLKEKLSPSVSMTHGDTF